MASSPTRDPRSALIRHLPGLLDRSGKALARDPADAKGLHKLRVALKRMRSLWRLGRALFPDSVSRREVSSLRQAARRLAGVRNRQVMDGLFRDLLGGSIPVATPSRKPALPNKGMAEARRVLGDSLRLFLSLRPEEDGLDPWKDAIQRAWRRARDLMPSGPGEADEAFHAWRKAVKHLVHGLDSWPGTSLRRRRKLAGKLDLLQERLGLAHDYSLCEAALNDRLEGRRPKAPIPKAPDAAPKALKQALQSAAAEKKRWKRKCLGNGRRIFRMAPSRFRKRLLGS